MGCLQSKKETSDLHPNVFRVVNIDENGAELCSGQLGITESDIILYREGRDSTVWPLHSLRRYGFEGEIFSFESGRRCDTGEGIYAFRCRRASLLFRSLQQQIQLRNVIHDSSTYPVSRLSPSPQGRQTLQASVVHRSSIDNGHQANVNTNLNNNIPSLIAQAPVRDINQSPRSPSSADILEVMPLYPRNQENSNHVTNVYQLREFKREHNNNQSESTSERHHVYSNDLTRDLAVLRNALRQEAALNTMRDIEDETRFLESRFINNVVANQINNPLSPTLSNTSEHYAQLSIEQQDSGRMYMNIAPSSNSNTEICRNLTLTTPQTPKLVEYCNLGVGVKQEVITYANLSIGEIPDGKGYDQKYSEFEAFNSMSPVEELEVNYVILDLEPNADETKKSPDHSYPENQFQSGSKEAGTGSTAQSQRGCLVTQGSVDKTAGLTVSEVPASIGYTTIDFDKTVALTSVASGGEMDQEGPRKTRHNTNNAMCGSPNSILKSN